MATVAIAGCGYVGNALAERLLADGIAVLGIRRDARHLAPGVRPVAGDLAAPASLQTAGQPVDLAVFAASAGESSEAAYRRTYLDGLSGFVEWLGRAGPLPRRLVFVSSTAVYGQRDGETVDESSPTKPASFRGEVMLEAEQRAAASGMRAIALRLGGIYGPGRDRLIDRARQGRLQRRPEPHFTNRIHRDDAAGALQHVLLLGDPAPVYLGVDDEPAEEGALFDWLAARVGTAVAPPDASTEDLARRRGVGSKRCSNALLRASGYEFRYPTFREGFGALLEE